MLRGISPILSPDLLYLLSSMGHGDDIVICDANFPATSHGQRLVRLDGTTAPQVLEAVLRIMPLDNFVDTPARSMEAVGDAHQVPAIVAQFQNIIQTVADCPAIIKAVERFDFYEQAKNAFAIIQTGEQRLYGNIILKKGVVSLHESVGEIVD